MPSSPVVLVVEDRAALRQLVGHILGRAGCRVMTAADGADALALAARVPPALVVCDLALPGQPVADFLRELRRLPGAAPPRLLIISGAADLAARAAALGADAWLDKPFHLEALLAVAGELLNGASATGDAAEGDDSGG